MRKTEICGIFNNKSNIRGICTRNCNDCAWLKIKKYWVERLRCWDYSFRALGKKISCNTFL